MQEASTFFNDIKIDPPQKTYFYEREDGSVIAMNAPEAWEMEKKRARKLVFTRQYGVSDGKLMLQALLASKEIIKTQGLGAAQAKIREGFEAEKAAAKGHMEMPPNCDMVGGTPGAQQFVKKVI